MKAYAYHNMSNLSVDLTLYNQQGGRRQIVQHSPMIVESVPEGELHNIRLPSYSWPFEMAESIFQALWDTGYRPAKGQGGAAEVEALKAHVAFAERITDRLLPKAK